MSDYVTKATGGHAMTPRLSPVSDQEPSDSATETHTIDTSKYAEETFPRGYARVANVPLNTEPVD